jgi:hypothetical protein
MWGDGYPHRKKGAGGCRCGLNWADIFLNAYAVGSQEQDISRRHVQSVGDRLAFSSRFFGILTEGYE